MSKHYTQDEGQKQRYQKTQGYEDEGPKRYRGDYQKEFRGKQYRQYDYEEKKKAPTKPIVQVATNLKATSIGMVSADFQAAFANAGAGGWGAVKLPAKEPQKPDPKPESKITVELPEKTNEE